jgi:two-component system, NtrC family, sensor kinase
MKILRKKKLIYKLLIFIIPFIFSAIIISSGILSLANYAFFRKTIGQDYQNIIQSAAGEIRLFKENAQKNLGGLALLISANKLDMWQKKISLTAFLHENNQFLSIALLSADGEKITTTTLDDQASDQVDKSVLNKSLSGQKAISGVMFSKDNLPIVHIAIPVFHLGQVEEILWAELNLKSLWDIVEGIAIGDTGQVYIMDASGRYIAHREIDRVVLKSPALSPKHIKELRESGSPVEWTLKENGREYYNLGAYISDLDWVIVLNQPVKEIYAYLYDSIYWAIVMTCIICLIAMLLGWNWVKKFLAPIHTLHRQVLIIGDGNLDQKISVTSYDEIGDLATAFNVMTDSLKEYIQREIESAKDMVHSKNLAVLGAASSKVTHEVRNLLNNIDMALAGLKSENLTPRSGKILQILKNESDRIKEFIQNFLQFAKKPELRLQKMPADIIIKELLSIHFPETEKKGVRITFNWDQDIPKINIDASLMHQVFTNLIKNSVEAISDSGEIIISGAIEDKYLLISFSDTGPGMDQNILNHLFEPFYTTKGKKGTGLGLSIVRSIIEAHRGTITYQSAPGKGATFIIHLPLN